MVQIFIKDKDKIIFQEHNNIGNDYEKRTIEETIKSMKIFLDTADSDLIKKGYFDKSKAVVFIHTGGTPALFVYSESFREYIQS